MHKPIRDVWRRRRDAASVPSIVAHDRVVQAQKQLNSPHGVSDPSKEDESAVWKAVWSTDWLPPPPTGTPSPPSAETAF